jgi:hypothetical protein
MKRFRVKGETARGVKPNRAIPDPFHRIATRDVNNITKIFSMRYVISCGYSILSIPYAVLAANSGVQSDNQQTNQISLPYFQPER